MALTFLGTACGAVPPISTATPSVSAAELAKLRQTGLGYEKDPSCTMATEVITKPGISPPYHIYIYEASAFDGIAPGNPPLAFAGFGYSTPLIFRASYKGPVLIRGLDVNQPGAMKSLVIGLPGDHGKKTELAFESAPGQVWTIELRPPGPGCYMLQANGVDFVEDVYFKVT